MDDDQIAELLRLGPNLYPKEFFFQTSAGWFPLLKDATKELEAAIAKLPPGKRPRAVEVKQKFGELRFVIASPDPKVQAILDEAVLKASRRASRTCEVCGGRGELANAKGYILVACEKHGSR